HARRDATATDYVESSSGWNLRPRAGNRVPAHTAFVSNQSQSERLAGHLPAVGALASSQDPGSIDAEPITNLPPARETVSEKSGGISQPVAPCWYRINSPPRVVDIVYAPAGTPATPARTVRFQHPTSECGNDVRCARALPTAARSAAMKTEAAIAIWAR